MGFSFTYVQNTETLAFLDLELSHLDSQIITKNHSKLSAGNSYLYAKSCQHINWVHNRPKSQFHRLRKNYPRDYMAQGIVLINTFVDKGYNKEDLNKALFILCSNAPFTRSLKKETQQEH